MLAGLLIRAKGLYIALKIERMSFFGQSCLSLAPGLTDDRTCPRRLRANNIAVASCCHRLLVLAGSQYPFGIQLISVAPFRARR